MPGKSYALRRSDAECAELRLARGKAIWQNFLCRVRPGVVRSQAEIRERRRLAELRRAGRRRHRDDDRPQPWHGANRSSLRELRQPSRPRLLRGDSSATDMGARR
jgi:hypothetical protein